MSNKIIGFIVDDNEKNKIKADAAVKNMSVSDHVRTELGFNQLKERREGWALKRK